MRDRARQPVLVITPAVNGADGVSAVTGQVVRAIAGQGPDVDVWALAAPGRDSLVANPVGARVAGGRARLASWGVAAAAAPRLPAGVVVLHLHLLPVAAPLMWRGVPAAVYLHGVECWRDAGRLRRTLLRHVCVRVAHSRHAVARFAAAHPELSHLEVRVCPPAVGPARATPVPADPVALIVGRMWREERYKGHDALLDVWPEVCAAVPGATLVVAGDGDDRPRLEARAALLGPAVRFTGLVPHAELLRLYEQCRLFVMPSLNEGFGLVYLEAMRAGRPCIAAAGAAEEIIEHGVSGVIVPAGDRDALRDQLVTLLSDVETCQRLGAAAAARVAARFTEAHFAACLRAALAPVLGGGREAGSEAQCSSSA